jgi:hypothetical protein
LRTLYSQITGTTEIDIKNSPSYELSYKNSSKYGITSQYPPCDVDGALHRRIQFVVFSDWYHEIGAATTFLTCIAKKFRKTKFLTKSCALQF